MFLPMNHRVIYGLLDPRTGLIRYVGVTSNPEKRMNEHLKDRNKKGSGIKKNTWINELMDLNIPPLFVFLDAVHQNIAMERELYWIKHFSCFSVLLNSHKK
jgi:predicted GIY-YIG superfamily endonuclease